MTATRFDLYGSRLLSLDSARELVLELFDLTLQSHDSLYFGSYYQGKTSTGHEVSVKVNIEDDEGELLEDDFSDFKTLVYINGAPGGEFPALPASEVLPLLRSETL